MPDIGATVRRVYIDHGAYCLDVGRRARRGKRANLAVGILIGLLLDLIGVTAAIVGKAPPWMAPAFVLTGLASLALNAFAYRRRRSGLPADAVLRIDLRGIELTGQWSYAWAQITAVRAWNAGGQGQWLAIEGQPADQRLATISLGASFGGPLQGIKNAVNDCGPGRYRSGRP